MADELSAALRELAAAQETAPTVGGPATRARAMRRVRRRRTAAALGAGTAALALLALAVGLHLGGDRHQDHPAGRRPPAVAGPHSAPPSTATPTPVAGTLDLSGRTLTFGGRVMPILSASDDALLRSTSPMTVVAKADPRHMPLGTSTEGPTIGPTEVRVRYVVELRDRRGRPHYIGLYTPQLKALSSHDVMAGWIGLGAEDTEFFYAQVRVGDTFPVTADPRPAATRSATATPPVATASPSHGADVAPSGGAETAPSGGAGVAPSGGAETASSGGIRTR
ncbi:hypothetical protein ABZY42_08150 [Streptomyces sp. NPDC006622]|uniref:hypothetical protein n=1 Tax=Streptomyces sp. NPDC006622 TaxID=3155459 RepID=UPI0033A70951